MAAFSCSAVVLNVTVRYNKQLADTGAYKSDRKECAKKAAFNSGRYDCHERTLLVGAKSYCACSALAYTPLEHHEDLFGRLSAATLHLPCGGGSCGRRRTSHACSTTGSSRVIDFFAASRVISLGRKEYLPSTIYTAYYQCATTHCFREQKAICLGDGFGFMS
jgi:hypothetical protein